MKRWMILAPLLATLPVRALADGQKAPSWYGRMSSRLGLCCGPTDCGHLWSNKNIKGNAAEAIGFGTRINGTPSTRTRSSTWTHPTGRFITASQIGR